MQNELKEKEQEFPAVSAPPEGNEADAAQRYTANATLDSTIAPFVLNGTATVTADALPIRVSNKTVQYIDFGFTSSREYWSEIVVPAFEQFKIKANRANAIIASVHAWHVHEWIWHEQHPGEDTLRNSNYKSFQNGLLDECPELAWIRDVADAGKHRGLGRPVDVQRVGSEGSLTNPLAIILTDGSTLGFAEVLSRVITYWRAKYFS